MQKKITLKELNELAISFLLQNKTGGDIISHIKLLGYEILVVKSGKEVEINSDYVYKYYYDVKRSKKFLRALNPSIEKVEEIDFKKESLDRRIKENLSSVSKKYSGLLDEYNRLLKVLDIKDTVFRPVQEFSIPVSSTQRNESVAVVLASDWHYEEEIVAESVNMMNRYNTSIADARIKSFFTNSTKLINNEANETEIKTIILGLLGDFITGNIHEDNIESSQMGPGDALWTVKSRISSGIKYMLENTDAKLIIPCHSGNHGRHTKKQMIANERNNSLEWLMYKSLADQWHGNKRVQFMIGESYHSYIDVFPGYKMRLHHGHMIKYGGGVGGITIPVNKAIAQWNRNINVKLDVFGHFHQYFDGGNFVCNSSLIGYSPYGLSVKGAFEKPSQSLFFINGKHLEKTGNYKIFLSDK
jgi:hypothetical protein